MDLLGRIEHLLGEAVERVFRSAGRFTPLDLDRSLRQELDRSTRRVLGRVFAPNRARIHLNPKDHDDHRTLLDEVAAQVTRSVVRHADHRGWTFLGPFELDFAEDATLPVGDYRFELRFEREPGATPGPADRTPCLRLEGTGPDGQPLALELCGGPSWTLGRDPGCDAVLEDSQVSARHARIRLGDDGPVVEDLASTNGVEVNGAPASRQRLTSGDRLRLGRTFLTLTILEIP